jgi:hypothetical protein
MPVSGPNTSRNRLLSLALPALVTGLALAACSGDSTNGGGTTGLPASTSYSGLWASNSGSTGPLSITFATAVKAPSGAHNDIAGASAAPNNATGTVGVNGTDVAISGSLDGTALHMTGAGGLDLAGTLSNGVINGSWTDGAGEAGNFAAASSTEATPARAYCGDFSGTGVDGDEFGTFSMVIAGAEVHGVAVGDGGTASDFKGTATPGASGGTFKVNQTIGDGTIIINDGVYNETETHGTYTTKSGSVTISQGSFTGLKDCPVQ